jgi:hypothetical protein
MIRLAAKTRTQTSPGLNVANDRRSKSNPETPIEKLTAGTASYEMLSPVTESRRSPRLPSTLQLSTLTSQCSSSS